MATVIEAAKALLGHCDGAHARDTQGFNGSDAPVVHRWFNDRAFLTTHQLNKLYTLLKKYTKQLVGLGFEYDKLTIPPASLRTSATGAKGTLGQDDRHHENASETRTMAAPAQPPSVTRAHGSDMDFIPEEIVTVKEKPFLKPSTWTAPPWQYCADEILAHFPDGFDPRPQQLIAISKISQAFTEGKRVVALEMPTGGGKSFICYAVAKTVAQDGKTHFLTIQKNLQDQYAKDFPSPMVELLKGRANYGCTLGGENAAKAPCTDQKKGILPECIKGGDQAEVRRAAVQLQLSPDDHYCPYWKQLQTCSGHAITLFNFSSFLFQQQIGRFGKRQLMIIDEAHNIESQLMNFVSMELTEWALSIIDVEIDREITSRDQLVEWLREKEVFGRIDKMLQEDNHSDLELDKDISQIESEALKELKGKIENFLRYLNKTDWVIDTIKYKTKWKEEARKIQARPLYAKDFAKDLLFSKADRILVMSATILDVDVWAENLGLTRNEIGHIETPCDFPVENRPIHLDYAGNCGRKYFTVEQNPKNPTKPKFIEKIKQILIRHQGQRGMIHCHSFELARVLRDEVRSDRFLFQDDFKGDKQAMLLAHSKRADSVMVAPAMHEGFDLKGDLSRFQVIAKIPWPSLGDKIIKERASRDNRWYGWQTALKLVQSIGRSVRSTSDWAYTYIVDSGFEGFFSRNGRQIPQYIKDAMRKYAPSKVRRG